LPAKVTKETAKVKAKKKVPLRWELDPEGLQDSLDRLGINWPVKISRTSCRTNGGKHYTRLNYSAGQITHMITVNKFNDLENAVKTLLHELRHAWQAENAAKGITNPMEAKRKCNQKVYSERHIEYWYRPSEIDAREAEKEFPYHMNMVRWNQ